MGVSRLGRGGGGVVFQMGEASLGEHPMGSHWF